MIKQSSNTRMIDITSKEEVVREATAVGTLRVQKETIDRIKKGDVAKGDPCAIATVSSILAAKNAPQIIPLCHPIKITHVENDYEYRDTAITVRVKVKSLGRTGVEMEALTAVTASLLTIWDMVKQYEKNDLGQYPYTKIENIFVESKVVNK